MNKKIFKAYDIRGIYPQEINEKNVVKITQAIVYFFRKSLNKKQFDLALGRDMRLSSPKIFQAVKNTLIDLGVNVFDLGLTTTPTVYFSVIYYKLDAGIQISASHNPKEYNGLKFFYRQGKKLIKIAKNIGMDEIEKYSLDENFFLKPSKEKGEYKKIETAIQDEINFAFNIVKPKLKPLKIVADPANAVGALILDEMAKKISCKLIKLNFKIDGTFPSHEANPLKFETLKDLQKKVVEEKAELGIATDGDADRVFFIDEKGQIIPATIISALITKEILEKNPQEKIFVDVRYVKNVTNVVKKYSDKKPITNVVGHALITTHLNKENGAFSGESSGHFFFRETGGAESTIRVILHVIDNLTKSQKKMSEVVADLMTAFESGEYNFKLPENINPKKLMEEIALSYPHSQVSWLDGVTVETDKWRFNIRSSNTEPLLRLNLEADTKELMLEKLQKVKNKILSFGAKEE